MENKAYVSYDKISVSWSELKSLPNDHFAAISVLSYAVSETNILRRLYLCQDHQKTGFKPIDGTIDAHRFLLLRTWGSKLFEAKSFLNSLLPPKPETKDPVIGTLAKLCLEDYERDCGKKSDSIAEDIRNETSFHYTMKAARKNLNFVDERLDCSFYTSKTGGNSSYPVGEAVMFHARLSRHWTQVKHEDVRQKRFEDWLNWNLEANRWLESCHAKFVHELFLKNSPRKNWEKTTAFVDENVVGNWEDRLTPMYARDFDIEKAKSGK